MQWGMSLVFSLLVFTGLVGCSASTTSSVGGVDAKNAATDRFDPRADLFRKGDMHASWTVGEFNPPPGAFRTLPKAKSQGDYRLNRSGEAVGGVTGFVYEKPEQAGQAYDILVKDLGASSQVVPDLGDIARSDLMVIDAAAGLNVSDDMKKKIRDSMPVTDRSAVVFMRGNTVVHIAATEMKPEELIPFAKKIDKRIPQ